MTEEDLEVGEVSVVEGHLEGTEVDEGLAEDEGIEEGMGINTPEEVMTEGSEVDMEMIGKPVIYDWSFQ